MAEHSIYPEVKVEQPLSTLYSISPTIENIKSILSSLKLTLESVDNTKVLGPWARQVDDMKPPSSKVIIGVVGATGSGKSSVINALLDELQLIPTNCMRACTAVVTEISWNDQPGRPWRATIEFLTQEEWRTELDLLVGDLQDDPVSDPESQAGIAFAKISAVYPHINKSNLSLINADDLVQKTEVAKYLSSSIDVEANTGEELHNLVKSFIDSKEKLGSAYTNADLSDGAGEAMDQIEYWPLIRRVRMFGHAPVLKSGCVIVDLPGVADSNAARGAVAKKYLKKCSALFVVAPIIRAVDDNTARNLLGATFKRQLHRDGTLSRLTFICSKTDDIVIKEVRSVLKYDADFVRDVPDIDAAKPRIREDRDAIRNRLGEIRQEFERTSEDHTKLLREEQAYKRLRARAAKGEIVHPPLADQTPSRKRPTPSSVEPQTPKRSRLTQYMSCAADSPSNNSALSADLAARSGPREDLQDTSKPALTTDDIQTKIAEIEILRTAARERKELLMAEKQRLTEEEQELRLVEAEVLSQEWVACVRGRNKYSSLSIQRDFAAGIEDLAREDAQDDDNFDPDAFATSEARPATSLPVFCVSSQGYQKLTGRFEGEQTASSFSDVTDTGILHLRAHTFQLGQAQLTANEEAFLNSAQSLLTSIRIWSNGGSMDNTLDPGMEDRGQALELLETLVLGLVQESKLTLDTIESLLVHRIYTSLPKAVSAAREQALDQVDRWTTSSKDPVAPGLHYQTFKATCRRNGMFANHKGEYNFARDLLIPFLQKVDGNWNSVFNTMLKQQVTRAATESGALIESFVTTFTLLMENHNASPSATTLFDQQVIRFAKSIGETLKTARRRISSQQKEANRLFEETVHAGMAYTYSSCKQESGVGSYARMKDTMKSHVDTVKSTMFLQAADKVQTVLKRMMIEVTEELETTMNDLCIQFKRDCLLLISSSAREFHTLEENVQQQILTALDVAEAGFGFATTSQHESLIDPALFDDGQATTANGDYGDDAEDFA